ncbi:hypothetical protein GE107_20120 [Cohnella sp. CFH 77786]|uniref:hypothetical protein n=1 Tax=Cohnella sp. CFH 77786 TaxID=2662265 RepID=UPI001C60A91F|nr:hypothetical protein [Cohnella sp. CFH 77786]MBW5448353.1 hypothetical protein [Cohnella sp. CFH 77786]
MKVTISGDITEDTDNPIPIQAAGGNALKIEAQNVIQSEPGCSVRGEGICGVAI